MMITKNIVELNADYFMKFNIDNKNCGTFNAICVNMRSLINNTNFAKLEAFVYQLYYKPVIICIT